MEKMTLEFPASLAEALRLPAAEQQSRLRQELAIRLYQKGLLSFGKARELAAMDKWEFHQLLGDEGIIRRYEVAELKQDLQTLEMLD